MRTKLILFDIDGTLAPTPQAHLDSFADVVEETTGKSVEVGLAYAGKTDHGILVELLEECGVSNSEVKTKMTLYEERLLLHFNERFDRKSYQAFPGTVRLLKKLAPVFMLGVITGNLEAIAKEKLSKMDIDQYFSVGAFGDMESQRWHLLETARSQVNVPKLATVNVGDTVMDMDAGVRAGIRPVGVSTGRDSESDLESAGAFATLPNLTNYDLFLRAVT